MTSYLYADAQATPAAAPSPFVSMAPLLIIFVIFYFLLIRPQQKKVKAHKKMLEGVKKGDRVVTSSGFFATVVGVGDNSLEVKLAENLKVKILKSAVSEILGSDSQTQGETPLSTQKA